MENKNKLGVYIFRVVYLKNNLKIHQGVVKKFE